MKYEVDRISSKKFFPSVDSGPETSYMGDSLDGPRYSIHNPLVITCTGGVMELRDDVKNLIKKIRKFPNRETMLNTYKYNEGVRKAWTPMWVRNLARTYQEVERRFAGEDVDIKTLPRVQNEPILMLGSGPSLDDWIPRLKSWKGAIACSTSQLLLLEYLEIAPTYLFLIDCDPNPEIIKLVGDYQGDQSKTVFITHPQVPREYLEIWRGPVKFFRMLDPGDEFSTKYVPMAVGWINQNKSPQDSHIGSYVLNSGNVVNAAIPVLGGLGYAPIFVCGYDLGYPKGVYRGSSVNRIDGKLELQPPAKMPSQKVRPIKYERGINGVLSDELCYFYKYSFMILYGLGNVPVLSCSRGLLGEVPYIDPRAVVATQGRGFDELLRTPVEAYEIGKEYLHTRQIYILRTDFQTATVNIFAKGGWWKRLKFRLYWHWQQSRPWAWKGDRVGLFTTAWRTWKVGLKRRQQELAAKPVRPQITLAKKRKKAKRKIKKSVPHV